MPSSLRKTSHHHNYQAAPKQKRASHLHVVLQPTREFKVLSTSPVQRLSIRLQRIINICSKLAFLGLTGAIVSYFALISVEYEVNQNLRQLEKQMKNREDLKSYLGKAYSWSNLQTEAQKAKMVEAKKVETINLKKTSFHTLFDL